MLNIAERHLNSHPDSKKFPFIYPLVYSNDHKQYTAPLNLWDLFENSEDNGLKNQDKKLILLFPNYTIIRQQFADNFVYNSDSVPRTNYVNS